MKNIMKHLRTLERSLFLPLSHSRFPLFPVSCQTVWRSCTPSFPVSSSPFFSLFPLPLQSSHSFHFCPSAPHHLSKCLDAIVDSRKGGDLLVKKMRRGLSRNCYRNWRQRKAEAAMSQLGKHFNHKEGNAKGGSFEPDPDGGAHEKPGQSFRLVYFGRDTRDGQLGAKASRCLRSRAPPYSRGWGLGDSFCRACWSA